MDLITLEEYKTYNGLSANPKDDPKIALLISSISALIQTYLGIDFEGGKSITRTLSVDYDTDKIYLDHYPIESVVSVSEMDRYTTDSTVHVPLMYASQFSVNLQDGIITRIRTPGGFANWPVGPGSVTVTYVTAPKWDIDTDDLPADLKLACIELVNYYRNEEFRQSKTIQGSSIINTLGKGTDFPQHIQVILDKYK
jgi:hypothetical protein